MSTELDTIAMTKPEVQALIAIEPILRRLGLSLYCLRCHANGDPDGVRANNATDAPELVVTCGCAVRRYIRNH